ncbi:MAG TPA: CRISPR-associated endonuclease Cas3'' [Candidatus Binataceae bacterium]|nr:CRISPR-associated endonuclease Cas3'' [Candidatus Binataceae bacterium]HVB80035.1 CRISPR-associated endonuclease Cas3'' [Candidatus Binataceae bacterium]
MPFAHSRNSQGVRHDLITHLCEVANLAGRFGEPLSARELAYYAGLWHDVGKFRVAFQEYLGDCEDKPGVKIRGPDHKAAGAKLGSEHLGLAALVIQGHHGGLKSLEEFRSWLDGRAKEPDLSKAIARAAAELPNLVPNARLSLPEFIERDSCSAEFFVRMLFSALVDADYLDTERHFRPDKSAGRSGAPAIELLWSRFEQDQTRFSGRHSDPVSLARHEIFEACLSAADQSTGFFRLSVPTGGGKTRSAMAFALRHALRHGLGRVVMAVPFISITEQTADVYRRILGKAAVLEHHSAVRLEDTDAGDFHNLAVWAKLAAENWDAPIIVTTTVQLFESLFSNSTSHTRKLHRLARSVIILDEAQALPAHLLTPILDALSELCIHYGTTVVVSTATQPAFEAIPGFAALGAREIVPEPRRFFGILNRVRYEWLTDQPIGWDECARLMRSADQCLTVVNTKRDAIALLDALGDPDALHLSTLLCGAHRHAVIASVRERLAAGAPCRLVSTQVIEAGVDLDFPLVMRAMGPLDSIIQAAGRCNREGRLPEKGRVIIFTPQTGGLPPGFYKTATGVTSAILAGPGKSAMDANDASIAVAYFKRLFDSLVTDREGIQKLRRSFDYPQVAARFRMIDDLNESVVVFYGSSGEQRRIRKIVDRLRAGAPEGRQLMRRLQPWIVPVRTDAAARFRARGLIREITGGIGEWLGGYDPIRGLTADDPVLTDLVI